jgi:hypothetical protein
MSGHFGQPTLHAALWTLIAYAVGYGIMGWIARTVLRDPRIPRWIVIVIVVGTSHLVGPPIREAASYAMYGRGLREGFWPIWWLAIGVIAFLAVLLWSNHIPLVTIVRSDAGQGPFDPEPARHEPADPSVDR